MMNELMKARMLTKKASKRIAVLINSIEVSYIMLESAKEFEDRKLWLNYRIDAVKALKEEFNIELPTGQ
jgi:hypothetical protein